MHDRFTIYKAMTFRDDDIDYVRSERKFWAQRDQDPELDKKTRKEAQRWVKVCTIVLECMTGMRGGKWEGDTLTGWPQIPAELSDNVQYLFEQAVTNRRTYQEVLDAANEYVRTAQPDPRYMRDWLLPDGCETIGEYIRKNPE